MGTKIFVYLPVKDLPKSKEFFSRIGFSFNEKIHRQHRCLDGHIWEMVWMEPQENKWLLYTQCITNAFFRQITVRRK